MKATAGNWTVGKKGGMIVTDTLPDANLRNPSYDLSDFASEMRYYGGYLIAESVQNERDAQVMAASKDTYNACKQIVNGIDTRDFSEFICGVISARLAIEKAEPKVYILSEKLTILAEEIKEKDALIKELKERLSRVR